MLTCASMFSGGRGADLGMQAAGCTPIWSIEIDPAINAVGAGNIGDAGIVSDALFVCTDELQRPDVLWASPVCKSFSQANTNGKELDSDIDAAQAVRLFLAALQPRIFILENVEQYRHARSFKLILSMLMGLGYDIHYDVLNSADFGVPQTRRRLILRARNDGLIVAPLPPPVPWVGWYDVLKDTLIANDLKPYQLSRIAGAGPVALVDTNNDSRPATVRLAHEPAPTIPASWWRRLASQGVWICDGKHGNISPQQGALLQSFPAWYKLPPQLRLAGEIVGNAVPPLLAQRITESML